MPISRRTIQLALDAFDFSTNAKIDEFIAWFELDAAGAGRSIGGLGPRVAALKLYLANNLDLESPNGGSLHDEIVEYLFDQERLRLERSRWTEDEQPIDRYPELVAALRRDGFDVHIAKLVSLSGDRHAIQNKAVNHNLASLTLERRSKPDMDADYFDRDTSPILNVALGEYELARKAVEEAKAKEIEVRQKIHEGFVDRVMVFIDMVGSTEYKVTHAGEPERWLFRVHTFCSLIQRFVDDAHGRVVKYIGDEVMAVFDRNSKISDAMNLVLRVSDMQDALAEAVGETTEIKVTVDYGKVVLLEFDGHNEPDPQGTPVDRCARIGKFAVAGTVLSSQEFVDRCSAVQKVLWKRVGEANLKGLGETVIYQLGTATIEVYDSTSVRSAEYRAILAQLEQHKERTDSTNGGIFLEDFSGTHLTPGAWQISGLPTGATPSPSGLRLVGVGNRFPTVRSLGRVFPESGDWSCVIVFSFETARPCGTSVKIMAASQALVTVHQDSHSGRFIDLMGVPRLKEGSAGTETIELRVECQNGLVRVSDGNGLLGEAAVSVGPTHLEFGNDERCDQGWTNILLQRVEVRGVIQGA